MLGVGSTHGTPTTVIVVNGPSSAGKSTLVKSLHDKLSSSSPYARVAFDDFLQHMNTRFYPRLYVETVRGDCDRLISQGYDGKAGWEYVYDSPDRCRLIFNEHGSALLRGLHRGWKAHVDCGTSLIVDAFLQDAEWARDLMDQIKGADDILLVGARCDMDELVRREKQRGDRPLGLSRRSSELVHTHGLDYDITVDLTDTSIFEENVEKILKALSEKKSLCAKSASELARLVASKKITCSQLLEVFIERVESSTINAVVVKGYDRARARAKQLDEEGGNGLLRGVPCTVKESFRVKGMREPTNGYPSASTKMCETSDRAVELLEAEGAVIFGKTNLPLRSADVQTFNAVYGQTNNPWDVTKTPGGSSGGSAAAVAARLTPFCLGTDIGGSIRIPVSHCSVFGHKTTFDIVPPKGHLRARDLSVVGPIAHSPEDLDLVLRVIATGPRPRYLKLNLPQPPALPKTTKIAFFPLEGVVVSASVRKAMVDLKEAVCANGTTSADWARPDVDYDDMLQVYLQLLAASNTKHVRESLVDRKEVYQDLWRQGDVFTDGLGQTYKEWSRADQHRDSICDKFASFFCEFDFLVAPCYPTTPPPHDHSAGNPLYPGTSDEPFWRPGPRSLTMEDGVTKLPYNQAVFWAALASLTRLPSTAFPAVDAASDHGSLPIGLQVIGPEGHDFLTIHMARFLSKRSGLPPTH